MAARNLVVDVLTFIGIIIIIPFVLIYALIDKILPSKRCEEGGACIGTSTSKPGEKSFCKKCGKE